VKSRPNTVQQSLALPLRFARCPRVPPMACLRASLLAGTGLSRSVMRRSTSLFFLLCFFFLFFLFFFFFFFCFLFLCFRPGGPWFFLSYLLFFLRGGFSFFSFFFVFFRLSAGGGADSDNSRSMHRLKFLEATSSLVALSAPYRNGAELSSAKRALNCAFRRASCFRRKSSSMSRNWVPGGTPPPRCLIPSNSDLSHP